VKAVTILSRRPNDPTERNGPVEHDVAARDIVHPAVGNRLAQSVQQRAGRATQQRDRRAGHSHVADRGQVAQGDVAGGVDHKVAQRGELLVLSHHKVADMERDRARAHDRGLVGAIEPDRVGEVGHAEVTIAFAVLAVTDGAVLREDRLAGSQIGFGIGRKACSGPDIVGNGLDLGALEPAITAEIRHGRTQA